MYVKNLVEDTCTKYGLQGENGLSFYIETAKHRILFDTGKTDIFLKNAKYMGIDLTKVDTVIISHGHHDHGGGLKYFLEMNHTALIYIHECAFRKHFSSPEESDVLPDLAECDDISIDPSLKNHPQVVLVSQAMYVLDEELTLLSGVLPLRMQPKACRSMLEISEDGLEHDKFSHEQHLAIKENGKFALFCGCCHTGIANVLEYFHENYGISPNMVVGGFHLTNRRTGEMADKRLMEKICAELDNYPSCTFYTCHSTGVKAYEWLRERMGSRIQYISTGDAILQVWG